MLRGVERLGWEGGLRGGIERAEQTGICER